MRVYTKVSIEDQEILETLWKQAEVGEFPNPSVSHFWGSLHY
jgi:hypothetical protein